VRQPLLIFLIVLCSSLGSAIASAEATKPDVPDTALPAKGESAQECKDPAGCEPIVLNPRSESHVEKSGIGNLSLGVNYVFPVLDYQFLALRHWTVGITAMFFDYVASPGEILRGGGGFITLNYYGKGPFDGLWLQGGPGVHGLTLTDGVTNEYMVVPAVLAQVGYRWRVSPEVNVGVGVGGQYLIAFQPKRFVTDFRGLLPALTFELGFTL
jgi:hypothetical protein